MTAPAVRTCWSCGESRACIDTYLPNGHRGAWCAECVERHAIPVPPAPGFWKTLAFFAVWAALVVGLCGLVTWIAPAMRVCVEPKTLIEGR